MSEKSLINYFEYLVQWLQEQVRNANANGLILGISGGIDSAVCAKLMKLAFPNNHLAVIMPCHSNEKDQQLAEQLSKSLNLNTITVDLTSTYDIFHQKLKMNDNNKNYQLAAANSKSRLRMTTLYTLAQANNYLVIGTDNADEWYIGYFTKYGDGAADLVPIVNLLKSQIRKLAKILNIPESIISRPPSAGLWDNQTDENELGFTYDQLDGYLLSESIDQEITQKISALHSKTNHKRNLPISPQSLQKLVGDK